MISRKRALASLSLLVDRGLVTPDQAKGYAEMVRDGTSYRDLMLAELGKVVGELYVREEEAQKWVLHGLRVKLSYLSVPEVLLTEDDPSMEPWHRERYSEAKAKTKFEAEAAEPWHPSLRERFRPEGSVVSWFRKNPGVAGAARRILKTAYSV